MFLAISFVLNAGRNFKAVDRILGLSPRKARTMSISASTTGPRRAAGAVANLNDFTILPPDRISIKIVIVVIADNTYFFSNPEVDLSVPARACINDDFSGTVAEDKFIADNAGDCAGNGGAAVALQLLNRSLR